MSLIGIYGGTFNPIHIGHLATAKTLKQQLGFDEMRLMPCHIPAHRGLPDVSTEHRLAMLKLALQDYPELMIEQRELQRQSTSYTIESLRELRMDNPNSSLCFCMGMDAFNSILSWHQYNQLLDYCHIVVAHRPDDVDINNGIITPNSDVMDYFKPNISASEDCLRDKLKGCIYFCTPTKISVSSTQLRQKLAKTMEINDNSLPAKVAQYIQQHQLYIS